MLSKLIRFLLLLCFFSVLSPALLDVEALGDQDVSGERYMVKRSERRSLFETEYGEVSAVKISDGSTRGPHHLQFITLEPNSLLLPALLHAGMVFYVHTGSGRLSWADEKDTRSLNLRKGDVFRLHPGTVFFIESDLAPEREKLRIYALFTNTDEDSLEPAIGAYTGIRDLILGFDNKVLGSAFKVPEELIEELRNTTRPPPMIHALTRKKKTTLWELEARFLKAFMGGAGMNSKKKKTKAFNILDADPEFENCNGWSLTVDSKDMHLLKDSNIGVFMVNLTKGSMMGPHWNPMATELAIVLHGQGMVRVVCPSTAKRSSCKNTRFRVEEGDVFAVPRFHPMAQMSFNNDSFVFMGFSTTRRRNYPQFLAGKRSVLQALDNRILAASFNVSSTTMDQLLAQQTDSIILECTSCAEEEERIMEEEMKKEREEEEKREREEERKREEEKRREEEEKRREEEERKREEEEEARKKEEEEARRRKEEEERERKEREEEEEKERKEREEEQERERKEREEEEEREREREEEKQRQEETEEEEARKKQEEREREKKQEEEERRRREAAAKREEEEARRQEEKRQRGEQEEEGREREDHRKAGVATKEEKEDDARRRVLKHV